VRGRAWLKSILVVTDPDAGKAENAGFEISLGEEAR